MERRMRYNTVLKLNFMENETINIERQCGRAYEPARIEVINISVEAGFALSGEQIKPGPGEEWGDEEW